MPPRVIARQCQEHMNATAQDNGVYCKPLPFILKENETEIRASIVRLRRDFCFLLHWQTLSEPGTSKSTSVIIPMAASSFSAGCRPKLKCMKTLPVIYFSLMIVRLMLMPRMSCIEAWTCFQKPVPIWASQFHLRRLRYLTN
ncbi:hypothetical protein PoB_000432000 [Plakobranchus ocellatus]|uniref:Uncharacterized protein n=1 Tax=Plakobranchus ocellatus TaxID=259542 RepID=A0AAV3Y5R4_9GAST|nr:hypothetical protein PoB_000432000 [Plakobranchus ocellatus]